MFQPEYKSELHVDLTERMELFIETHCEDGPFQESDMYCSNTLTSSMARAALLVLEEAESSIGYWQKNGTG